MNRRIIPQGKRDAENHSKAVKKAGDGARGGMYDGMPLGGMSDYKTHYEVSFYGTSPAGGYDESLEEGK